MKRLFSITVILIVITWQSAAQKYKDILYLKSGSKIYGTLLEVSDNQYKIRLNDSTIFTFQMSEVEKYEKEKEISRGRYSSGFGFTLEAGILIGAQSSTYDTPFSFNALLNYAVRTTNVVGLGTGAEFLGKTYTPVFIEIRKIFRSNGVSPYLFARGGILAYFGSNDNITYPYSPNYYLKKDYKGGPSFTLGAGISWPGDGIETNLSFAYRYARTSYVQSEYQATDVTFTSNYNRLELKVGFRF
jgi:preprotein translocase subunit YajC